MRLPFLRVIDFGEGKGVSWAKNAGPRTWVCVTDGTESRGGSLLQELGQFDAPIPIHWRTGVQERMSGQCFVSDKGEKEGMLDERGRKACSGKKTREASWP